MTAHVQNFRFVHFSFATLSYTGDLAVKGDGREESVTENREMLDPPQRRQPAIEIESKPTNSRAVDSDELISRLDTVLHADLRVLYGHSIPDDERQKIVVDVISDFIDGTAGYDADRGSEETLGKTIARRKAIDYLRHADVVERAKPNLKRREDMLRSVPPPCLSLQQIEEADEHRRTVERVTAEIEQLPQNLRRAALAYMRHGDSDPQHDGKAYSTILAEELGVEPGLVAQWWCRAKKRLKALKVDADLCAKRSE